jgi:DNA-binding response OmpR family regulator
MPKMNGLEMAKAIRKIDKKIPIIIVTAHTQSKYLLEALDLQLIKYIVKPVTVEKLTEALTIAYEYIEEDRTESLIKFSKNTIYDTLNQRLIIDNQLMPLSHNEILFTNLLLKNHQRVVSYEEIGELIWAYEGMSKTALRTLVQKLRHKLQGDFIENVSGAGYRLKVEV